MSSSSTIIYHSIWSKSSIENILHENIARRLGISTNFVIHFPPSALIWNKWSKYETFPKIQNLFHCYHLFKSYNYIIIHHIIIWVSLLLPYQMQLLEHHFYHCTYHPVHSHCYGGFQCNVNWLLSPYNDFLAAGKWNSIKNV